MPVAHFQQLTIWFALKSHIIRNMHHRCRMNWEIHLDSLRKGSVPECPTWNMNKYFPKNLKGTSPACNHHQKEIEESYHFRCSGYVLTIFRKFQNCELTAEMSRKSPAALLKGRNVSRAHLWDSSACILFFNFSGNNLIQSTVQTSSIWLKSQIGSFSRTSRKTPCKVLMCCHCGKGKPEITDASMLLNMIIVPVLKGENNKN